ncbi:hypothetical protein O9H85_07360 [Paenibacillus filicis]|uniref:Uncharacterized protein n=1 Tax=Paenibacillus gyeongsangnamensis TaxID=3388067 RepID=A0ABT4Q606_9BACL|nr:hypothetical protein [Paenibacillus filicis]MCZ8512248.1 hypothetical protein [Paenibacillus filicis]
MKVVMKVRFIERDYFRHVMAANNELTEAQIEKVLNVADQPWADFTFTFFENGSTLIIDNDTDLEVSLRELKGAASEFYVKQKIRMIRSNLEAKILQSA